MMFLIVLMSFWALHASSAASTASTSATATQAETSADLVKLVSKDKKAFDVRRAYLMNPVISNLTARALENDPDADEMPIPHTTGAVLGQIVPLITKMGDMGIRRPYKDLNDVAQYEVTDILGKTLGDVSYDMALQLLSTANYMDSPYLIHLFAREVARGLKPKIDKVKLASSKEQDDFLNDLNEEFQKAGIRAKDLNLLPELSVDYFLLFDEDIDKLLGLRGSKKTDIPFDVLVHYKKFNDALVKEIASLRSWIEQDQDVFVKALEKIVDNPVFGDAKTVRALSKLSGFIINTQHQIGTIISKKRHAEIHSGSHPLFVAIDKRRGKPTPAEGARLLSIIEALLENEVSETLNTGFLPADAGHMPANPLMVAVYEADLPVVELFLNGPEGRSLANRSVRAYKYVGDFGNEKGIDYKAYPIMLTDNQQIIKKLLAAGAGDTLPDAIRNLRFINENDRANNLIKHLKQLDPKAAAEFEQPATASTSATGVLQQPE